MCPRWPTKLPVRDLYFTSPEPALNGKWWLAAHYEENCPGKVFICSLYCLYNSWGAKNSMFCQACSSGIHLWNQPRIRKGFFTLSKTASSAHSVENISYMWPWTTKPVLSYTGIFAAKCINLNLKKKKKMYKKVCFCGPRPHIFYVVQLSTVNIFY